VRRRKIFSSEERFGEWREEEIEGRSEWVNQEERRSTRRRDVTEEV